MKPYLRIADKIIRGKQRIAVSEALRIPRTGKQILELAKQSALTITYQDLRHILRKFQDEGVAVCLNPENQTGRLYVLTSECNQHQLSASELELQAKLRRAKARLAVLQEIGRDHTFDTKLLTATQIRKNLLDNYPMGLNHILSTLKFLLTHQLIEITAHTDKRNLPIYKLTESGKCVMKKMPMEDRKNTVRCQAHDRHNARKERAYR